MSDTEKNKLDYLDYYSDSENDNSEDDFLDSLIIHNYEYEENIFKLLENIKKYTNDNGLPICENINFYNLSRFLEK